MNLRHLVWLLAASLLANAGFLLFIYRSGRVIADPEQKGHHQSEERRFGAEKVGRQSSSTQIPRSAQEPDSLAVSAEANSSGPIFLVGQRKRILRRHPEWSLPEFSRLTDADWLRSVESFPKDTEDDARQAFGVLRQMVKQQTLKLVMSAVQEYKSLHQNRLPESLDQTKPYLKDPIIANILPQLEFRIDGTNPEHAEIVDDRVADEIHDALVVIDTSGRLTLAYYAGATEKK